MHHISLSLGVPGWGAFGQTSREAIGLRCGNLQWNVQWWNVGEDKKKNGGLGGNAESIRRCRIVYNGGGGAQDIM